MTEHSPEPSTPPAEQTGRRIPAVAEALGYAGGGLALAALLTLLALFWHDLGVWGRAGVSAGVAFAGLAGGLALERLTEPAARRLSHFLLFIGVAGVGGAAGFIVDEKAIQVLARSMTVAAADAKATEWAWFLAFAAIAVSGGVVWWRRRTWLQHLAFGVGVGTAALLVLPLVPIDGPEWGPGAVLAFVGVVWGALALSDKLPPQNAALTLASLGVLGGIEMMAWSDSGVEVLEWGVWLGLAVSVGLVVGGAYLRKYVPLGLGAAGVVVYAIQLVSEVFDFGMGTPLALLGAGLLLIAASTYSARRFQDAEKPSTRIAIEVAGYAGVAFALAGVMTLYGEYWDRIGSPVRTALPAGLGIVLYVAARDVARAGSESARRLALTLSAAGAVAIAATAGMATFTVADGVLGPMTGDYLPYRDPGTWAGLVGASVALIAGFATWWFRRGVITLAVPGAACFMLAAMVVGIFPYDRVPFWLHGTLLLSTGLLWVAMGVPRKLTPGDAAIAIGSLLTIIGVLMLQNDPNGQPHKWTALLGLALALAAIGASLRLKRGVLLGFGAAGVVIFSFVGAQSYFENDIGAPLALLVTGVVFIAMAILVVLVMPRLRERSHSR